MNRVGYRAVKSPVCVKKSKTKTKDLKTIFLKALEKRRNMWPSLIFVKNKNKNTFYIFFTIFFNPPNYESYRSNFFVIELALKIELRTRNMHFNPIPML